MKSLVITLFVIFSLGCSSSNVHLYSRYLSESEIKSISKEIKNLGYNVVVNKLSFPEGVNESTIIYPPLFNKDKNVEYLITQLAKSGWSVSDTNFLTNGNHWYNNKNVGLFLIPDNIKRKDHIPQEDIANEYVSRGCGIQVKLILNADNTYELDFSNNKQDRVDHLKGIWKIRSYPYLELTSFNERWWFYFEISQKKEVDKVSQIEMIELAPQDKYRFISGCNFVYGQRVSPT